MSDLREQICPYLRDDIDSVAITIPQGLVRKLMEVNMLQTARIEELEKKIKELEDALESLADDEWWDMETPTTAADFALKTLQRIREL